MVNIARRLWQVATGTAKPWSNSASPNLVQVINAKSSVRAGAGDDEEFQKNVRETATAAINDGLINKSVISALFLSFNIPSLLEPPDFEEVDKRDGAYLTFFVATGIAVAAGFYNIMTSTLLATHGSASGVTAEMALVFQVRAASLVIWNHRAFYIQVLATSVQLAAFVHTYMGHLWAYWLVVAFCIVSAFFVMVCKQTLNHIWDHACKVEDMDSAFRELDEFADFRKSELDYPSTNPKVILNQADAKSE